MSYDPDLKRMDMFFISLILIFVSLIGGCQWGKFIEADRRCQHIDSRSAYQQCLDGKTP